MENENGSPICMTCNAELQGIESYAVFYTFLKSNGTLLADALERCLLLPDVATLPGESHALCAKCYTLLEEFADLELRFRQLRANLWSLHKLATLKRNQNIGDLIRGISVQTDDIAADTRIPDEASEDPEVSDTGVESLAPVNEEMTVDELVVKDEEITVHVDPCMDPDDNYEQPVGHWALSRKPPKLCKLCGTWFGTRPELESHMAIHKKRGDDKLKSSSLEEGGFRKYIHQKRKCKFCKRQFRSYREMRNHLSVHSSERLVYKCRLCRRTLVSKSGASYHAKAHAPHIDNDFDLEKAFNITAEAVEQEAVDEDYYDEYNETEGPQSSSEEDEVPLSARRKEFMFEKIQQEVKSENLDLRHPVMQKKALEELDKFSEVKVTKISQSEKAGFLKLEKASSRIRDQQDVDIVVENIENAELRSRITQLSKSKSVIIRKAGSKIKPPARRFRKMAMVRLNETGAGEEMVDLNIPRVREFKKPAVKLKDGESEEGEIKLPPVRELKFKCDTCGKLWRTKGELNAHKYTHSDARPYICEICGQAYKHKHALDVHVGMHKGIFQHQCQFCQKAFTQKGALQRHLPIHTGDLPFQCELCGKRFVHRTSFSIHTLAHSGVRNIKCEVCNLGVLSKSHLRRHMRIHSGEKPYECSSCGKTFAERYNLVAHQRIHDPTLAGVGRAPKKKQHLCRLCGATYPTRHKLEEHMVSDHNKVVDDPLQARPGAFDNSDSYLQPRFIINESESSSKAESQHSDDGKRTQVTSADLSRRSTHPLHTLRGVDILRAPVDSSIVRTSLVDGSPLIRIDAPHGWAYINPTS